MEQPSTSGTSLSKAYRTWAKAPGLPPGVRRRVLDAGLRHRDAELLEALVVTQELTTDERRMILSSGLSGPVHRVLRLEGAGSALVSELLSREIESPVGLGFRYLPRSAPQHREALWDSGIELLRLGVLDSLDRAEESQPAWDQWLAEQMAGPRDRSGEILRQVTARNTCYAWTQVLSWGSPQWICELVERSEAQFRTNLGRVVAWASAHSRSLLVAEEGSYLELLGRMLDEVETPHSHGGAHLGAVLDLCEEAVDVVGEEERAGRLAERVRAARERENQRDALLDSVHGEMVEDLLVGMVAGGRHPQLEAAVLAHPGLTPRQGAMFFSARRAEEVEEMFDVLTGTRSTSWARELVKESLELEWQGRTVFYRLAPSERDLLVEELLGAGEPSEVAAALHRKECSSPASVYAMSLGALQSALYATSVNEEIAKLAEERLESDPARWECFEALAPGFPGSYGELLELASNVNAVLAV